MRVLYRGEENSLNGFNTAQYGVRLPSTRCGESDIIPALFISARGIRATETAFHYEVETDILKIPLFGLCCRMMLGARLEMMMLNVIQVCPRPYHVENVSSKEACLSHRDGEEALAKMT
jgi:hypothetical protein